MTEPVRLVTYGPPRCREWTGRGHHAAEPLCCERATLRAAIAHLEAGARRSNIPKAARAVRALVHRLRRVLRRFDRGEVGTLADRYRRFTERRAGCCWSGWPSP